MNFDISEDDILTWIEFNIIHPYNSEDLVFDNDDLKRIELICGLKQHCNPNDESLQVILHLLDQINFLHKRFLDEENLKQSFPLK